LVACEHPNRASPVLESAPVEQCFSNLRDRAFQIGHALFQSTLRHPSPPLQDYPLFRVSSRFRITLATMVQAASSSVRSFSLRGDSPTDRSFSAAALSF